MGSSATKFVGDILGSSGVGGFGAGALVRSLAEKTRKPPGPPGGPTLAAIEQERVKREEEDRKRREGQGRGASATLATSPLGDPSRAPTAANALLGVG